MEKSTLWIIGLNYIESERTPEWMTIEQDGNPICSGTSNVREGWFWLSTEGGMSGVRASNDELNERIGKIKNLWFCVKDYCHDNDVAAHKDEQIADMYSMVVDALLKGAINNNYERFDSHIKEMESLLQDVYGTVQ